MASTAPTAAPEETPMIAGSASGLRKKPCMTVPAAARAKPTIAASMIRGSRYITTIVWWVSLTSKSNSTCQWTSNVGEMGSKSDPRYEPPSRPIDRPVGIASALRTLLRTSNGWISTDPSEALTRIVRTSTAVSPSDQLMVRLTRVIP